MKYATYLKNVFKDTNLIAEDLLLLESFQIKYLPERVPQKEFATLLRTYPAIHHFLIHKEPTIKPFIDKVLKENSLIQNEIKIEDSCHEVIWEIGELIIYNKYPETYDSKINFTWKIEEILSPIELREKTVADVGAGSGMLSILLSKYSEVIHAIEPLGSFRNFMQKRINKLGIDNVFILDGFLNKIPLPNHSLDFLFTSNALGWNFEEEQKEIERVIKPGGQVIHLMRAFDKDAMSPHHDQLIDCNYQYQQLDSDDYKAKYSKFI